VPEVICHEVDEKLISEALADIPGRTFRRWHSLRYNSLSLRGLQRTRDELLDHVAARSLTGPSLDEPALAVLRTAAECAMGVLELGAWPFGDFLVRFPLVDETISSEELSFGDSAEFAPDGETWFDAFAMTLIGGQMWEPKRVIAPLLKGDCAPAIRKGLPHADHTPDPDPASLAAMDAFCDYLVEETYAEDPLRKPTPAERAAAAHRLDTAGPLTPDQQLLRVLLDDDQQAFEEALEARLIRHHEDSASPAAAPRTLLPIPIVALAALATRQHGWTLATTSGYLPPGLLHAPTPASP